MNDDFPPRQRSHWLTGVWWGLGLGAWVAATAWGAAHFARYSFTPGVAGQSEDRWPVNSELASVHGDRFNLVVALHPECPCSQATLGQIDQLLAERPDALRVQLLFVDEGTPTEASDLWKYAGRIPGVIRLHDPEGTEARRFALHTSGEARLFAPDHRMRFSGGLTVARGHAGASPGCRAVLDVIDGKIAGSVLTAPVFGCALFDEARLATTR